MIKPGMLIQWKPTNQFRWGWYFKEKPTPVIANDNIFSKFANEARIYEQNLTDEFRLNLADLNRKKSHELSQVPDDESKTENIRRIHVKYLLEEQEIQDKINLFNFQYALLAIEKLVHKYKVGNVLLKERVYWQCIMTKRNGDTLNIWVDEKDVEPYVENSYDIKNVLLTKHLERRANKKK